MLDLFQNKCDEIKNNVDEIYKLLDAIVDETKINMNGILTELRIDNNGTVVFLGDRVVVATLTVDLNAMTVTCARIVNDNIIAKCVRTLHDVKPFSAEFAIISDKTLKRNINDWFFAISEAEYVEAPIAEEPEVEVVSENE